MKKAAAIDIFGYLDLSAYLRDVYEARKSDSAAFSFRAFSRKAGLRSPNHLKRVIDGERVVTEEMAPRYAAALGLTGEAADYFAHLAAFCRAKTSADKNEAYRRLAANRGYRRVRKLETSQAAYHENWYVPAIRELAALPDFDPDPGAVAARLIPPISRTEAEKALTTLRSLGMLAPDAAGRLRPSTAVVSTGAETRGLHIYNYHRAMLGRAAAALDLVPGELRDVSSLTFCTDEAGLRELKVRLQAFRKELVAFLSEREAAGDRVVQLNMQLFPLSNGPTP